MQSKKITDNLMWRFLERCGAQGVSFFVSLVLARLLDPSVFGTIALVTVFTTILNVFLDSGLSTALIQKKDVDDVDYSTIFWFKICLGLVLYLIMFFAAPFIASFYARPELKSVVRVMALQLPITSVKAVQSAYVSKNLIFKKFFYATLGGTIGAAVIGIWMAFRGYGVWALVIQNLFNQLVDTLILWIVVKYRPNFVFSFERLKGLFSFGSKIFASSILDTLYNNIRQLIIGKLYSSADLAFYNKGKNFPNMIITNINSSIDSVLLPSMASKQDNVESVKSMVRRSIKVSTFLMAPILLGLAGCAKTVVTILITEKWLPSVFFMRIFCITFVFYPVHTANLNAIKALGKSDIFLKLEIIKKVIGLIALVSTMFISVKAMAVSLLFTSIMSQIINSWPNKKLLNYSYLEQLKDIMPGIGLATAMAVIVWLVELLKFGPWLTLAIQVPLGILIFTVGSKVLKIDTFDYVIQIAKNYLPKKKANNTENDYD